jgi:D-glycero-D-manno-heptose 1,7-bisphosphate phosphatase
MAAERRPAAFLDRDGTIIEDRDFLGDPGQIRLLPGAARAIARLNEMGLPVVVVTNQSGIGRGLITEADYAGVRERLDELLSAEGARLLQSYHCPHAPDREPPCDCRKPAAGLYHQAAAEHDLDLARSVYVGDRTRDIDAGLRFGGVGYLLGPPESGWQPGASARFHQVDSLSEAVDHLGKTGFPNRIT